MKPTIKTSENGRSKIMIVDDHPIFRRGIAEMIGRERDLELCGEEGDASGAMRSLGQSRPDLMVIDLSLAGGSGLELVKQVKAFDPTVKVLVCTMHDEKLYGERAIGAGADGFLNKEEAPESLIRAIREILRGKVYVSEQMAERFIQQRLRGSNGNPDLPEEKLSDREFEIFQLLGEGQSSRKIAKKLGLSPKTIDTHLEHIKEKLGAGDHSELVHRAVEWVVTQRRV